jgi:hypothetical protein
MPDPMVPFLEAYDLTLGCWLQLEKSPKPLSEREQVMVSPTFNIPVGAMVFNG